MKTLIPVGLFLLLSLASSTKGSYIYGVGKDKKVYRQQLSGGQNWEKIINTGAVISIAAQGDWIYGVGTNKDVWRHQSDGSGNWQQIIKTGEVISIAAQGDWIYGVGTDKKVWRHQIDGSGKWVKIISTGQVVSIAIDGNYMYGSGTAGDVWKYQLDVDGNWNKVTGPNVISIAIKGNYIYGVGKDKKVYKHQLSGAGSWVKIINSGSVIGIAVNDEPGNPIPSGVTPIPGCNCSDKKLKNQFGGDIGACLVTLKGKFWCYLDQGENSGCPDKKKSSRPGNLWWGYKACEWYTEYQPNTGK